MGIIDAMKGSKARLIKAKNSGGFFYFVGDAKGKNAALLVYDQGKDAEGKKTFREGRGLIGDFKKEHGKALYCQGEIITGSRLTFSIQKGNAKPSVVKKAFKASETLKQGLGGPAMSILKSAKIVVAGAEETVPTENSTVDISAYKNNPELKEILEGLSDDEIREVMAADRSFQEKIAFLPSAREEASELEEKQGQTERMLDEIANARSAYEAELAKAENNVSHRNKLLQMEEELKEKQIQLARLNSVGGDPFLEEQLEGPDLEALQAALRTGLELLQQRLVRAREETNNLRAQHAAVTDDQRDAMNSQIKEAVNNIKGEVQSIEQQKNKIMEERV